MQCEPIKQQNDQIFSYQKCQQTKGERPELFMSGFPALHARSENEMHEFGKTFATYLFVEGQYIPDTSTNCCSDWGIGMKKLIEECQLLLKQAKDNIQKHNTIISVSRSNQVLLQVLNTTKKALSGKTFVMVAPEIYASDMPTLTSVFKKHSRCKFQVHYSLYDDNSAGFKEFDSVAK
mgnify:FL=1